MYVPRSSTGKFEHVFSNWTKFDVIRVYLQIKYLYIPYFALEIVQLELYVPSLKYLANIYLFKRSNRCARIRCGMYSTLVIKTTGRRQESFCLYDTGF